MSSPPLFVRVKPYATEALSDVQNPYSDISLFLSKKIKQQMERAGKGVERKFEFKPLIIEQIESEFHKKFPDYSLSLSAIKRVWDRVSHLAQTMPQKETFFNAKGKLNLPSLIRENLKIALKQSQRNGLHPFFKATQLAHKIAESIALLEGVRPVVQHLIDLIWSAQKHMLPPSSQQESSQNLSSQDRLILKWMIDIWTEDFSLSHEQLLQKLEENLQFFISLKDWKDSRLWTPLIYMKCSEILFGHLKRTSQLSSQHIQKLKQWIEDHLRNIPLFEELESTLIKIKFNYLLHPNFPLIPLEELEIWYWHILKSRFESELKQHETILGVFMKQLSLHLIEHPTLCLKSLVQSTFSYFQTAAHLCSSSVLSNLKERLLYWSLQGELALCFFTISPTPILHFIEENQNLLVTASAIRETYLSHYSHPLISSSLLHQRIEVVLRYFWYHHSQHLCYSPLQRWLLFHCQYKACGQHDLEKVIFQAEKQLPLIPLDLKWTSKMLRELMTSASSEHKID